MKLWNCLPTLLPHTKCLTSMSEKEAAVVSFTPLKPKYSFIVKKNNALQYENSEYVSLSGVIFYLFLFPNSMYMYVNVCVWVCVCGWVRVCVPPSKFILYIYACHFVPIGFCRFYLPWGSSCSRQQSRQVVHGMAIASFILFSLFSVSRLHKR